MIFLFHLTIHIIQKAVDSLYKNKLFKEFWDPKLWCPAGETFFLDSSPQLHFMPQCYLQRYTAVCNVLSHEQNFGSIRKVVDFGCAELGFFLHLKTVEGVEDYVGVDIDFDLVTRCSCKVAPQMYDCLYGVRKSPLSARVYCGSVTDYDPCLKDVDAVVCIELIEHLHADVLEKLPANIFNRIRPRLAIFTTPNCEFNVLFVNFSGLRHLDHKFEWTRREFQDWAVSIVKQFPEYSVKLYGICPPPKGREDVGCCSQMAVFKKAVDFEHGGPSDGTETYRLIQRVDYPFSKDERSDVEKVVQEVRYRFFRLATAYDCDDSDDGRSSVPLEHFLPFVADICPTLGKLREILETEGWKVRGPEDSPLVSLPEEESEAFTSGSEGCLSVNNSVIVHSEEEVWTDGGDEVLDEKRISGEHLKETSDTSICTVQQKISYDANDHSENSQKGAVKKNNYKRRWDLVENESEVEASREPPDQCYKINNGRPLDSSLGFFNGSQKVAGDRSWGQVASVEVARYESDESEGELEASSWRALRSTHVRTGRGASRLAKSFSLDSCLENINCERAEVQAMYLSMHSRARTLESGSPSERGPDSGYPISYSQDLSEQPDLATSDDSLSECEDAAPPRPLRLPNLVPLVENGDVANNNRDGEGNNVEGVRNPLPPPFLPEEFPPWLLHLLMDPPPLPPQDEGLGEDSGSELSDSPAGSIE